MTLLERVIQRVWEQTQDAPDRESYQLGGITLAFLSLVKKGEPATLDYASIISTGVNFEKFRRLTAERKAWIRRQIIPDYDPEEAARMKMASAQRQPFDLKPDMVNFNLPSLDADGRERP